MKTDSPSFNPYLPEFAGNPYVQYARLRQEDPVHKSFMGTWVLTRYADVARVLRDPNFSSDLRNWNGFCRRYANREQVGWLLTHSVLNTDPPVHTQLKKALTTAFGTGLRQAMSATLADLSRAQIATIVAGGPEFDAIEQFALPVPVRAVAHLYQLSHLELETVKRWSVDVSRLIEPLPSGHALEDAERSIEAFKTYLSSRLASRDVPSCLPTRFADASHEMDIDEEHVLANLILMFPAGHETTVNLIGNGLYTLLRHPAQLQLLREHPELITRAVEEILRYEPPQQVAWRSVIEDCEIAGKPLRQGEQVMMVLGAANRDPEAFERPEAFDITRGSNPHLSFGIGRHACLGSWFARLQGAVALSTFLEAFPRLELRGRPEWYTTMSFHGLKSLPVSTA